MRNTANSSEALGDKKMRKIFQDKTVVLGVTGSIAAYKIANLASSLVKKGANVHDKECY